MSPEQGTGGSVDWLTLLEIHGIIETQRLTLRGSVTMRLRVAGEVRSNWRRGSRRSRPVRGLLRLARRALGRRGHAATSDSLELGVAGEALIEYSPRRRSMTAFLPVSAIGCANGDHLPSEAVPASLARYVDELVVRHALPRTCADGEWELLIPRQRSADGLCLIGLGLGTPTQTVRRGAP